MLKDVLFITQKVFNEALEKDRNLINPKKVYDVYRSFQEVLSDVKLVANHYLALNFTEEYLQNSSWGEPIDKWRKFLNMDFEELNKSVKKYLLNLSELFYKNLEIDNRIELEFYIERIYHSKLYEVFIRNSYSIGMVESDSCFFKIDCLNINPKHPRKIDIFEHKKIDLSTFEARENLKKELNKINNNLKIEFDKLKSYIQNRFILNDLL